MAAKTIQTFWKRGDVFIWLTGMMLSASLVMVTGLLLTVLYNGVGFFWPREMVEIQKLDGSKILGNITVKEKIPTPGVEGGTDKFRWQLKQGNREIYGMDFVWINADEIATTRDPSQSVILERMEWGDFYGFIKEVRAENGKVIASGPEAGWKIIQERLPGINDLRERMHTLQTDDIGKINYRLEKNRLQLRHLSLQGITSGPEVQELEGQIPQWKEKYAVLEAELGRMREQLTEEVVLTTVQGAEKIIPLSKIVRVYSPNTMGLLAKVGFFCGKVIDFIWDDPRESNTEGGVFPAIFGTVMMVFLMSLMATPLGILAAIYLREFARQGAIVSMVRIAVNNLAGVPSIVFGVFGVGFFIYLGGGTIDRFFYPEALPTPTYGTGGILWASLTMALMTVPVVIVATEEGLASVPQGIREASLAVGATRWETTWRVVIPAVMPSILTGLILAMARAAGEVAPLMITGVVKMAPTLPIDGIWPFVHLERKFMHLGFHIYDVGFQSPNVDAAKPMVFATTLLLIGIVVLLNLAAIYLRNRFRKNLAAQGI